MDNKLKLNPTAVFTIVAAFILIISLAFILRGGSEETETTEPIAAQPITEQPSDPEPRPAEPPAQPDPQPAPDPEEPVDPPLTPPAEGELPADWDELTSAEKTERNPFDCDIQAQWISADDGSCINKPAVEQSGINIVEGPDIIYAPGTEFLINLGYTDCWQSSDNTTTYDDDIVRNYVDSYACENAEGLIVYVRPYSLWDAGYVIDEYIYRGQGHDLPDWTPSTLHFWELLRVNNIDYWVQDLQ